MANMAKDDLTVYQLRAMDYEYASRFAQIVASTALKIVEETDDPGVRERALEWRLWAMPEARSSAFDQDPMAGLLELWALAAQQRHYLTEGDGQNTFGNQQAIARDTARYLEREVERLAAEALPEDLLETTTENVRAWVDEHPIEGELFVRSTARADLAGLVSVEHHGGLKAVGSMEETVRDMSDRITILSAQMPSEARWQAEFLVEKLFEDRVHDRIDSMVGSLDDMTAFLADFEGTLSAQTQALLAGIERERLTVFEAIESERIAVVDAIGSERDSILEKLDSQLVAATTGLDSVGRGLIDHFFIRLIEVLAGLGVFVFLMVLLVLFVLRRRGAGTIDRNPPTE